MKTQHIRTNNPYIILDNGIKWWHGLLPYSQRNRTVKKKCVNAPHERKPSDFCLNFQALQSDRYSCVTDAATREYAKAGRLSAIRLLSAKEAGQILSINANTFSHCGKSAF